MKLYFTSSKFKKFIPDWITVVVLIVVFFNVLETAPPFTRQFSVSDSRIAHPFAIRERFTDNELYLWSLIVPSILISIVSLVHSPKVSTKDTSTASTTTTSSTTSTTVTTTPSFFDKLHLLQVSNLGLWFSVVFAAVLTDILKCWIGNPRPDFLSRCGPAPHTPPNKLVDIDVCTAPLGPMYLMDGMKSTPSGHSSMSFAGLLYLSLWLVGQFRVVHESRKLSLWLYLLFATPILLACYIALSRTQDYRHHFFDVGFGSLIGLVLACFSYFKYFNGVWNPQCNLPIDY
ncbi:phosphatidic acid phosphatase type 2/haloperoxidase [Scheffersomyces amazonensis]|uniref:phosphatidic acid phosphatase type 2/haloperoxidase n=1 Tax=Scheffersomyces amazonensis TaxID=1078765 RepID=UPI00315CE88F